jgi:hypothetical protein
MIMNEKKKTSRWRNKSEANNNLIYNNKSNNGVFMGYK